ncbi:MAG TPA: hypothetical protein VHM24_06920 [Gemmatimonadaceae bacterium]|nr:hypothetical protein [Gemmatimonadaceae bacterium]
MRKLWSLSLALVGITALSSCGALDALGSGRLARGTFELRTVNGVRIPAVLYTEPGYRIEVLNANFTLEDDGTYSEAGIIRETVNGSASTSSSSSYGTYDYFNGDITFYESSGRRYYGRLSGSTLIIEDQGLTMEYQRF